MVTDLRITDLCRLLRISGIASCFQELEPTQETEVIRSFLLQALETEVALRAERRRFRAIKTAGFPTLKRFDDLDPAMLPDDGRRYLPLLQSLTFLEEHQNILMIGNSGTGKTHLSLCETLSTPPSYFLFLLPKPRLEYRFHSPSRVALGAL